MLRRFSKSKKEDAENFSVNVQRANGTLGLTLTLSTARVTKVLENSTAAHAGLQIFDRITAVNGEKLLGKLGDALARQQGPSI